MFTRSVVVMVLALTVFVSCHPCVGEVEFHSTYSSKIQGGNLKNALINSKVIGQGGQGEVRKMTWGDKEAAVKIVTLKQGDWWKMAQLKELEFLKSLKDTGAVVELFSCMITDTHIYIIQELLYNSLDNPDVIEDFKGFQPLVIVSLFSIMAQRILEIHLRNVIHSDIKPENIMIKSGNDPDFRLVDFGVSNHENKPIRGGTEVYLSFRVSDIRNKNEQALSKYSDDVYSFAITMAVLLSSRDAVLKEMDENCFRKEFVQTCKDKLIKNIDDVFRKRKVPELTLIVERALGFTSSENEITTMSQLVKELNDCSKAIEGKFKRLKSKEQVIKESFESLVGSDFRDEDLEEKKKLHNIIYINPNGLRTFYNPKLDWAIDTKYSNGEIGLEAEEVQANHQEAKDLKVGFFDLNKNGPTGQRQNQYI